MCRLILIFFFVCVIAAAILLAYAPWYVSLGVLIGGPIFFYLFMKIMGRVLLKRLPLLLIDSKSSVLRGASLEVHEVILAPQPIRDGAEVDPDEKDLQWYSFEITVTPSPKQVGMFVVWEPGELIFTGEPVPVGAIPDDAQCVDKLDIFQAGSFIKEEGLKYEGPQRIRFTAGMKRGWKKAYVHYYLERLGEIELPK